VREHVLNIRHDDLIVGHLLVFTTSPLKRKMMFVVAVSVNQDSTSNLAWKSAKCIKFKARTYVVLFNANHIILVYR